jgi:hypothetical protein
MLHLIVQSLFELVGGMMNKTCSQCIYFHPTKTIKDVGKCQSPVPYWVREEFDSYAFVSAGDKGIAPLCEMFTEEQVDVEELKYKLFLCESDKDLLQSIADEYGKAS